MEQLASPLDVIFTLIASAQRDCVSSLPDCVLGVREIRFFVALDVRVAAQMWHKADRDHRTPSQIRAGGFDYGAAQALVAKRRIAIVWYSKCNFPVELAN